jgi:hypothetical protein
MEVLSFLCLLSIACILGMGHAFAMLSLHQIVCIGYPAELGFAQGSIE